LDYFLTTGFFAGARLGFGTAVIAVAGALGTGAFLARTVLARTAGFFSATGTGCSTGAACTGVGAGASTL
jgi:hypothetical protein